MTNDENRYGPGVRKTNIGVLAVSSLTTHLPQSKQIQNGLITKVVSSTKKPADYDSTSVPGRRRAPKAPNHPAHWLPFPEQHEQRRDSCNSRYVLRSTESGTILVQSTLIRAAPSPCDSDHPEQRHQNALMASAE